MAWVRKRLSCCWSPAPQSTLPPTLRAGQFLGNLCGRPYSQAAGRHECPGFWSCHLLSGVSCHSQREWQGWLRSQGGSWIVNNKQEEQTRKTDIQTEHSPALSKAWVTAVVHGAGDDVKSTSVFRNVAECQSRKQDHTLRANRTGRQHVWADAVPSREAAMSTRDKQTGHVGTSICPKQIWTILCLRKKSNLLQEPKTTHTRTVLSTSG